MEADRKLLKARINIVRSELPSIVFWGPSLAIGSWKVKDGVPTAYTNGRDEVYGREFIDKLNVKETAFIVLHENYHKLFRHLDIWKKLFEINPKKANMACDYVNNRDLRMADPDETIIAMPRKPDGALLGLYDPKYDDATKWDTKAVFDDLMCNNGGDESGNEGGNGGGEVLDDHDWEGAQDISEEESKELNEQIEDALRQGEAAAKKAGLGSGGLPAGLDKLLRPEINWKQALQEFISRNCVPDDLSSYRRPNRKYAWDPDLILPTLDGESLTRLVVGADLSHSMWTGDPSDTQRVFTEIISVANMVKPQQLDVLYWDAKVAAHEEYKLGDYEHLANVMKPTGGGGTDPSCVPVYLKDKRIEPDCIVMLTDGEVFGEWGNNYPAPVLWVIVNNPKAKPPFGKVVHAKL